MHCFKIHLLSIVICLSCCLVTIDARMRIVGGNTAARGEYPFYFWAGGSRLCGGSLIWGDFVLTAAHCGHHVFYKSVKYGSTNVVQGTEIDINKLFVHPKYNDTWMANDVMLIQIKKFIPQSEVKYVTLNTDPKIPVDGAPITAMGYGADGKNHYTESLMKVDLNVVGYNTCVKTYGASVLNHTHMICNGGPAKGGKDSCQGDSGGPIMLTGTDVQVGLVSWGRECGAKDTPAVNARVSEYVPWIQEHICMYSVQPPLSCPPGLAAVVSPLIMERNSFKKTLLVAAPIRKSTIAPIRKPTLAPIRKQILALAQNLALAPIRKPTLAPLRKVETPVRKTSAPIYKVTSKPVQKPSLKPIRKPTVAPIQKQTSAPIHTPTTAPIRKATTTTVFEQAVNGPSSLILTSSLQSIVGLEGSESTDSSTLLLNAEEGSEISTSLSADSTDAGIGA